MVLFTIPTTKQSKTQSIPAHAVPVGTTGVSLSVDVTGMTLSTQHFDASAEVSFDGGLTWQFLIGCSRDGFTLLDALGAVVSTAGFDSYIGQPNNSNRQVRCTIAITGGPYTLGATLSAS